MREELLVPLCRLCGLDGGLGLRGFRASGLDMLCSARNVAVSDLPQAVVGDDESRVDGARLNCS